MMEHNHWYVAFLMLFRDHFCLIWYTPVSYCKQHFILHWTLPTHAPYFTILYIFCDALTFVTKLYQCKKDCILSLLFVSHKVFTHDIFAYVAVVVFHIFFNCVLIKTDCNYGHFDCTLRYFYHPSY